MSRAHCIAMQQYSAIQHNTAQYMIQQYIKIQYTTHTTPQLRTVTLTLTKSDGSHCQAYCSLSGPCSRFSYVSRMGTPSATRARAHTASIRNAAQHMGNAHTTWTNRSVKAPSSRATTRSRVVRTVPKADQSGARSMAGVGTRRDRSSHL